MIISTKRNTLEVENNLVSSGKMHVNAQAEGHLIRLLTRAYSDKIGSIVRESAANAKDSHTMSNQENPVIVRIVKEQNGNYSFEVQDTGLGLDDLEFKKYIMGIGESTKQLISNVLGGFGMGSKAASSYHEDSSYYYTCRKNGTERKFMIFAAEDIPDSMLIYEKETEEGNGVIVNIPIKDGDRYDFEEKIKEQLCYFSGIYFENCGINNDFKIYRHDLFQWSELCQDDSLHITLDDVYYPLDYNKLGIAPISVPIGLRFNLEDGFLTPIPNRESLEYTKETKKIILDKIQEVADWFLNKYNETNTEFTEVEQIYDYFNNSSRYVKLGEESIKINNLFKYTNIKCNVPTFKNIEKLKLETINSNTNQFLKCYSVIGKIENGRYSGKGIERDTVLNLYYRDKKLILCKQIPNKRALEFIKDTVGSCYFVAKKHEYKLGKYSHLNKWQNDKFSYASFLMLQDYLKSDWRQVIKEWNSLEKLYENDFINLDSLQITKEWEEERKRKQKLNVGVRNQKLEGEVNFKFAESLEKTSQEWNCKFVSKILNLKNFYKRKSLTVYGLEEQRPKLDNLWQICKRDGKVKPCIVGQRDYEKLKKVKLHNLMSIEELETTFNKPIARYVTAYKISKFYAKYVDLFNITDMLSKINTNFAKSLIELKDYKEKHKNEDNELMNALEVYCEKYNYFDQPIYQTLQEVSKNIDKLDFIKFFIKKERYSADKIPDGALPIIQELLIARKFRMDWKCYVKEPVKEETVEELELVEQN